MKNLNDWRRNYETKAKDIPRQVDSIISDCREIQSIWRKPIYPCLSCCIIDNFKTNSRSLEIFCKRLYFNYFKERLVHFNGTIVSCDYNEKYGDTTIFIN